MEVPDSKSNSTQPARLAAIVQATIDEIREKGENGTSLQKIAWRAGVTREFLFYHYHGKDRLFLEAHHRLLEPERAAINRALNVPCAALGLRQFMSDYVAYWVCHAREYSFSQALLGRTLDSPVLGVYAQHYLEEVNDFYLGMILKMVEQRKLASPDAEAHALAVQGALTAVVRHAIAFPQQKVSGLTEGVWHILFGSDCKPPQ